MPKIEGPASFSDVNASNYSLTIRLDRLPRCPICGRTLCGAVTQIRAAVAWCDRCNQSHPTIIANHLSALLLPELIASQSNRSGVVFWCPKNPEWTTVESVLAALGYPTDLLHTTVMQLAPPDGDPTYYLDLHRHTLNFFPAPNPSISDVSPTPPVVSNPNTHSTNDRRPYHKHP